MQVKLIRAVDGKFGTYPADTWLDVTPIDGFLFVSVPGDPHMKMKRIARSNVKEWKQSNTSTTGNDTSQTQG